MQTYTISLLNSAICSFATTIAVAALRYQVHIAKIFYLWFQNGTSNGTGNLNKKAVLPQGNRAMLQVFFSVEVRQQHSLQV